MASFAYREIIRIFHSGYFYYTGAFRTLLDSYRCVTRRAMNTSISDDNWGARRHRIFHFLFIYFLFLFFSPGLMDYPCLPPPAQMASAGHLKNTIKIE